MEGLPSIRPQGLSRKALLQAAMTDKRISQAEIARRSETSEATVSRVVAGTQRNDAVENALAAALGMAVDDLFPSREAAESAA
jgi:transcriptional regulator with XRE-family HTH domain